MSAPGNRGIPADGGQKPPEAGEKVTKSRGTSWKSHYLKSNDPQANLNARFSDHP
jgi:hypothetical protein